MIIGQVINNKVLWDLFSGGVKTYTGLNRPISENYSKILQFPFEFVDSLELIGLPPRELNLKVGAIVVLIRNINVTLGPLNETHLIVRNMYTNTLDLGIMTGRVWSKDITPKSEPVTSEFHLVIFIQKETLSDKTSLLYQQGLETDT